ncbi:hypothetical protein SCA6_015375 [Theobroma cacao]
MDVEVSGGDGDRTLVQSHCALYYLNAMGFVVQLCIFLCRIIKQLAFALRKGFIYGRTTKKTLEEFASFIIEHIEKVDNKNMYNATMLYEAGVKFEAVDDDLLNVKFEKGVLQIPYFPVVNATKTIFRNLMEGIFENERGSSAAVANMINNLRTGVTYFSFCFDKSEKDLNQYYDNSWNRTKATLKHVYFNNPWRGTTTVAAFIIVVLTLLQTILAILERAIPTK